jgi:tetratricopeptide (TPR) repeat protein
MIRKITYLVVLFPFVAFAVTSNPVTINSSNKREAFDRNVDKVALAAQDKSIQTLTKLLKNYRGKRQEPVFLIKLAELHQQNGSIHSRIAHGSAHQKNANINLTNFHNSLKHSIVILNELIAKFPGYEEMPRAYFMRGKANEEIRETKKAAHDFEYLVKNFPDSPEVFSAYMSLAEFAIEANDHAKAIKYLSEIEKYPDDSRYPFALYKLAWSYYNLKNIPQALSYVEKHVAYYNSKTKTPEEDQSINSNTAFKENMLQDATVFFEEGLEQKLPQYQLSEALPYFKKLEEGPHLGKMLLRFGKLLRSHGREKDLMAWKDQLMATETTRPETLDVVLITFEFQVNKRYYTQLIETSRDVVKLYKQDALDKDVLFRAQKMLLDTADGIQKLIVTNKDHSEVNAYRPTLIAIYDSFTKIVPDNDARITRAHYNLAEALFAIKDFSGSTDHYRWIVEHGNWKDEAVKDASIKAIAARYEVLRQKNFIPKEVKPQPLSANTTKAVDPMLNEWNIWIDTHGRYEKNKNETMNFIFEACRALYAQGHMTKALKMFNTFSTKYADSKFAIPSASLIVDTYIASNDWHGTYKTAVEFMEVKPWQKTDFSKKLYKIASDSFYKIMEEKHKEKDYAATLKYAEEFVSKYKASERYDDVLSLSGNAAMELKDKKTANKYFSALIKELPQSENVPTAILARAAMEEERYNFAQASADYKYFLSLSPAQQARVKDAKTMEMRKKVLILSWLSEHPGELAATLETKNICVEKMEEDCEKYRILALLDSETKSTDEKVTLEAFRNAQKGSGENGALWAALALEGVKHLEWRDRLKIVKTFLKNWDDMEPMVKYTIIPKISVSIPKAFALNRAAVKTIAPLKANDKWITRRVEVIREIENAATKVMNLPWARIRAEVLNETASLYIDLARGLTTISPPKGMNPAELASYEDTIRKLVMPFEEKGQEMRGKAFEIASKFAIEDSSFSTIAEPFFAENPSQAKTLKPVTQISKPMEISFEFLDSADQKNDWAGARRGKYLDSDNQVSRMQSYWARAIATKRWQQVAFFMQEAKENKFFEKPVQTLINATSLAAAGARGEALKELDGVRGDLDTPGRTTVLMTLVHYSMQACGRDRTQSYLKEIQADQLSAQQASLVTSARAYAFNETKKPAEPKPNKTN